jgi:hypothetical protein
MATPRKRATQPRNPRRQPAPVQVISPRPQAWLHAKQLADGRDVHLEPQPDGSVLVVNNRS